MNVVGAPRSTRQSGCSYTGATSNTEEPRGRRRDDLAGEFGQNGWQRSIAPVDRDGVGVDRAGVGELTVHGNGVAFGGARLRKAQVGRGKCGATLLTVTPADAWPTLLFAVVDTLAVMGNMSEATPGGCSDTCAASRKCRLPAGSTIVVRVEPSPQSMVTELVRDAPGLSIEPLTSTVPFSSIDDFESTSPGRRTPGPVR